MLATTLQRLASFLGADAAQDLLGVQPIVVPGDATVSVVSGAGFLLTKGSAAAIAVPLPTQPGVILQFMSDSAFAHVMTFTGNGLRGGTAAVATATLAAQKGAGLTVQSLLPTEAAWGVVSNVAATLA